MQERRCRHCEGREFRVSVLAENHSYWGTKHQHEEQWFCPRCDWGRWVREEEAQAELV